MQTTIENDKVTKKEKIVAFLFSVFFVAQILSPSINEKTIYLEVILMIINPYFWRWIMPIKITFNKVFMFILLLLISVLGHPVTALKISINIFSATALMYLWERKIWFIENIVYVSIFVALLQLLLLAIDVELAMMLGPNNISKSIWGSFATQTYTNFYDALGIGIPRASGLSREAGFFASLLVAIITHKMIIGSNCKFANLMYLIGYVVSFSKMSLVLLFSWLITKTNKFVNKIHFVLWIVIFLLFMLMFWHGSDDFLNDGLNITYLSRFGAYDSLWYMDIKQLLLGENDLSKVGGISAINEYYGENLYAGLGGWIINNGLLVLLLFCGILWMLKINSSGIILLLLLTINVQPDTNQNFVVYAWFICMQYFSDKKEVAKKVISK